MRAMTETCSYPGARDETLISYVYGEIDLAARASFEAHVASCLVCRDELAMLRGVRGRLAMWQPPASRESAVASHESAVTSRTSSPGAEPRWSWREIPAWAQVAAALLFLGVAAGIANLNVRYDANGLTVRTGWSKASVASSDTASTVTAGAATRADLTALEQQLRAELRVVQTSAPTAAHVADGGPVHPASDADLLRKVRALVDESEKRQQTELALRIGELIRDVSAQRQADLVRIDRTLGIVQNDLGVEVLKQRQQVNYLMRANQRQ